MHVMMGESFLHISEFGRGIHSPFPETQLEVDRLQQESHSKPEDQVLKTLLEEAVRSSVPNFPSFFIAVFACWGLGSVQTSSI